MIGTFLALSESVFGGLRWRAGQWDVSGSRWRVCLEGRVGININQIHHPQARSDGRSGSADNGAIYGPLTSSVTLIYRRSIRECVPPSFLNLWRDHHSAILCRP